MVLSLTVYMATDFFDVDWFTLPLASNRPHSRSPRPSDIFVQSRRLEFGTSDVAHV